MRGREQLARHRRHLAVDLECRRKIGRDEQVRALLAEHEPEQVMHEFRCLFTFHHFSFAQAAGGRVRQINQRSYQDSLR